MITKSADGILDYFWKPDSGPIENILGLVEYGYMFLGGFLGKIALMIATSLGISLRDLGRKLDEMFNLTSLQDLAGLAPDTAKQAMFASSHYNKNFIMKISTNKIGGVSLFELLFSDNGNTVKTALPRRFRGSTMGFMSGLKGIAARILGGGLLSFLTLKGIQTMKSDKPKTTNEDTNNTDETQTADTKGALESAIKDALAS